MTTKWLLFVPIAILVAVVAWFYFPPKFNTNGPTVTGKEAERIFTVLEQLKIWKSIIASHGQAIRGRRKILLGTNVNLDLIVSFNELFSAFPHNTIDHPASSEIITSKEEFYSTISYYLRKGAAAERFISDPKLFGDLTEAAGNTPSRKLNIGGNAALMAEFLTRLPYCDVHLYGPIGSQLRPLLTPLLTVHETEEPVSDEIHLIIEYERDESFGSSVAPLANRFIVHHDIANSEMVHTHGFFETATGDDNLDWIVWSGLHFLDSLPPEEYMPKFDTFKAALKKHALNERSAPIHMELASMANAKFVKELYQNVILSADSIGLNDQELMYISTTVGGPSLSVNNYVDKMTEAMVWILHDAKRRMKSKRHLTRIHMHSHRFHVIAVADDRGWRGSANSVLHGALVAAVRACQDEAAHLFDLSEVKFSNGSVLPHYTRRHPTSTWFESDGEIELFVVPTILCRKPVGTVGLGDAVSASALALTELSLSK